ncbi:MAG: tRNA (uridine(34)/cytosine(34)/5-carboxymethylaminomethyluridine(34)-2'-O)-methyltransferase TrmL [Ruminococcaceae bacterium]|nr:tRNA (uridine(34)/cytosine(34)/5-carboxymethylaminomethyluridine(34)-2'-O)-methyltransferase TrmL [Oscillospiraceae bacterium]
MLHINIVLHEPEIPQNTGNIARTCAVTGASLHLIEPLGFEIDSAKLKRAGLDYWDKLDVHVYPSIEDFFEKNKGNYFFFTSKTDKSFADVTYEGNVYLIFGKETKGLPKELIDAHRDSAVRIPMKNSLRCLNLSNAAAVAVYEVLRQNSYPDMI